jgi:hypothetical protein
MGNTRNTGYLQNAIKVSDAGAISFMSGSTMLATINTSGQMSGSSPVLFAATASFVANAQTASFVALAQSASNAVAAQTASFANAFTVAGNLTAQTLVVQTITSSVVYSSGSNVFGNNIANTQVMTGSVNITGSLAVVTNGTEFQVNASGVNLGNALTDSHVISGSLRINPNGLFVSSSGNIGIGNANPTVKLQVTMNVGGGYPVLGVGNSGSLFIAGDTNQYGLYIGNDGVSGNAWLQSMRNNTATAYNIVLNPVGGNVGIGTTSPYTRFQVSGGNASIQSDSTGATDGTGDVRRAGFGFRHASADLISALINTTAVADWGLNLHFNTRQFNAVMPATPAMTITAGQNVGIGTSSPNARLSVTTPTTGTEAENIRLEMNTAAVPASAGLNFRFGSVNGATIYGVGEDGSSGASSMRFYTHNGTSSGERMRITSGGDLLLKTTSTTATADTIFQFGNGGVNLVKQATLANNQTMDIRIGSSGVCYWGGFLSVLCSDLLNGGARTQTNFSILAENQFSTFSTFVIHTVNGSLGGRSFTITYVGTGIIRLTNTSGATCVCTMTFFGGGANLG